MFKRLRIPVAAAVVGLVLTVSCTALAAGLISPESKTVYYRDIKVTVDGRATSPDVVPFIVDPGWVMVPAEFMSKEMGATVAWDDATSTLAITTRPSDASVNGSSADGWTVEIEVGSVAPGQAMDVKGVVAKVSASLVLITTNDATGQGLAQGSGVVVGADVIATNLHVVAGASKVTVVDSTGITYNCPGVLAIDEVNDLALLSCETPLHPVEFGNSQSVAVGEQVVAIGSPRGLQGTVSDGVVSAVRNIDGVAFIQTTAPISPGSSGGGLFGMDGRLLGITTALVNDSQNLNLAVPTASLQALVLKPKALAAFPEAAPAETEGTVATFTWPGGDKYEGFVDEYGKPHGLGTYTWGSTGDYYAGEWYHGERTGFGTLILVDNQIYVGEWYEGLRHGAGATTWDNGDTYVGWYCEDLRDGLGTYTWANGDELHGEWSQNEADGVGTYTWADGSKYVGELKGVNRDGLGTMMTPDGRVQGGTWVNDVRVTTTQ